MSPRHRKGRGRTQEGAALDEDSVLERRRWGWLLEGRGLPQAVHKEQHREGGEKAGPAQPVLRQGEALLATTLCRIPAGTPLWPLGYSPHVRHFLGKTCFQRHWGPGIPRGSANHSLQAKACTPAASVNKVLLTTQPHPFVHTLSMAEWQ